VTTLAVFYLARPAAIYNLHALPLLLIFNGSCQTNSINIYRTDLRELCRVGRTMAADNQSEISFSIPQWTLPGQPIGNQFLPALSTNF